MLHCHTAALLIYSGASCSIYLFLFCAQFLLLSRDPHYRYNMVAAALSLTRFHAPTNNARRAVQAHAAAPAKPSLKTMESERVCEPSWLFRAWGSAGCEQE